MSARAAIARTIVYGAGAVGGVVAARLHLAGHPVVAIARGEHLFKARKSGLLLRTHAGEERVPLELAGHPSEILFGPRDLVILTVKSQDSARALDDLAAAAPAEIAVLCLQNGIANEREALRRFPNVYGGMVWMPATHVRPGEVESHGAPVDGVITLGRYPKGCDARAEAAAALLSGAGIPTEAVEAVMEVKRAKLLDNVGNAVQALTTRGDPDRKALYLRAREEAEAAMRAAGLRWIPREALLERALARVQTFDLPGRPRQGGSTWQSLTRHTGHAEADYLNGEIVLLGRLHGVPTPINAHLQRLIAQAAASGAAPGGFTAAEILASAVTAL